MIEEIKIDRLEELIHEMMIKIRNTSVTNSAEGNPIEIENAAHAPLVKCVTAITGYQSGSGTPSPDNIRPIVAYTEGEIEVSDGDGNTTTHTATFSQSIYQGNADFVGGKVTSDRLKIVFDGSSDENWFAEDSSVGKNFYINISDALPIQYAGTGLISNMFEPSPLGSMKVNKILISSGKNLNAPVGDLLGINTVEDWKTWLSTHNLEVAYNIDPTTETITPTNLPIKSLFGYTHIESSTGDMEVTYITEDFEPLVPTAS